MSALVKIGFLIRLLFFGALAAVATPSDGSALLKSGVMLLTLAAAFPWPVFSDGKTKP